MSPNPPQRDRLLRLAKKHESCYDCDKGLVHCKHNEELVAALKEVNAVLNMAYVALDLKNVVNTKLVMQKIDSVMT